jgi:hypothetical protein
MDWRAACANSPEHTAVRITQREGEQVVWIRFGDGTAVYRFRGRVEDASPEQVEGHLDWQLGGVSA